MGLPANPAQKTAKMNTRFFVCRQYTTFFQQMTTTGKHIFPVAEKKLKPFLIIFTICFRFVG